MRKNNKLNLFTLLNSFLIFLFSIFVNRGVNLDATSLGLNLQELSDSLPTISGFLQPHRILLPILGRIAGVELQILNVAFLFLFLVGVYFFVLNFTNHKFTFLFIACLGSTMVVQFTLIYGGYPDILCYLFLFLAFKYKQKNYLPYILFFLALLVKETAIFTLLFFFFLKDINKRKIIISFVSYLPIYFLLSKGAYSPSYFLDLILNDPLYFFNQSAEKIILGYFSSVKFLWFFLIVVIFLNRNISLKPVLYLNIGIFLQFFLGGDTTRFVSFIFLGFLYVIENIQIKNINKLSNILILVLLLNVFTPKYYVFAYGELAMPNESRLHFIDLGILD